MKSTLAAQSCSCEKKGLHPWRYRRTREVKDMLGAHATSGKQVVAQYVYRAVSLISLFFEELRCSINKCAMTSCILFIVAPPNRVCQR